MLGLSFFTVRTNDVDTLYYSELAIYVQNTVR